MKEASVEIYCSRDQLGWIAAIAADVLDGIHISYKEGYGYVAGAHFSLPAESTERAFMQMYEELVDEIERYAKEYRVGPPWYAEVVDPSDNEKGASLFLSESFEVSCFVRNEGGLGGYGATWTPYDLWFELEPPPPIDELLKED